MEKRGRDKVSKPLLGSLQKISVPITSSSSFREIPPINGRVSLSCSNVSAMLFKDIMITLPKLPYLSVRTQHAQWGEGYSFHL